MGNEFLRSHYPGFLGHHQALEQEIAGDEKVAFIGTADDEDVICVRQAIPQRLCQRDQSFSFGEINRQNSQVISDLFKFRPIRDIPREKHILKHNPVNGNPNASSGLCGKQLYRCWITLDVSDDYVGVQEHEWALLVSGPAAFERLRLGHLFHFSIVRRYGSGWSSN